MDKWYKGHRTQMVNALQGVVLLAAAVGWQVDSEVVIQFLDNGMEWVVGGIAGFWALIHFFRGLSKGE